jgi:hypothetical protein
MPSEGIKVLVRSGAVAQVKYRPSIYHKLKQKILAMSDEEKAAYDKSRKSNLTITGHESSLVIESLLDYQQFSIHPADRELLPAEQAKQNELFLDLASAPISNPKLPSIEADSQPAMGQGSSKASFTIGSGHGDHFAALEFRPTLHDLLDNDDGYTQFSQVEVGRTQIRYSEPQDKVALQSLELLNIVSLTPMDSIQKSPSWMFQAGALVPPDAACATCISGAVRGGVGASTYLLPRTENAIAFAFLKLNLEDGSGTVGGFRSGPSEMFGLDIRVSHSVRFLSEFEVNQYYDRHFSLEAGDFSAWTSGLSWNAVKNFELRLNGVYQRVPGENYFSGDVAAGFYF